MVTIKYKSGNEWKNISAYCTPNSTTQGRIDLAFGVGQTTCFMNLSTNIPPYTLIEIDNKVYCGYSHCNQYVQSNSYFMHKLFILPLESYLSGFVIGTKSFSTSGTNKSDYEKVRLVLAMVNDMGASISIKDINSLFSKSIEYQYGTGTTAWDIISDICRHNELRPILTYESNTMYFNVQSIIGTKKDIKAEYISNVEYTQSMDDYCNTLVTEATNVVDRTTYTHLSNVTCRTDEPVLTTDNAKLILPTAIESIKKIEINVATDAGWYITGTFKDMDGVIQELESGTSSKSMGTIGNLWNTNPVLQEAYNKVFYKYYTLSQFQSKQVALASYYDDYGQWQYLGLRHLGTGSYAAEEYLLTGTFDITNKVLPKEKWDMLTDQNKTSYAFYTHGGNTIENMHASYKEDLFNILLGNNGTPLLSMTLNGYDVVTNLTGVYEGRSVTVSFSDSPATVSTTRTPHVTDPAKYTYNIDYYPIADFKISTKKTISPFNESTWNDVQRSYNNGSSYVDFDKLVTGLIRENNVMGDVELSIELTVPEGYSTDYYAGDYIYYLVDKDFVRWYISSVVTTHRLDYKTIVLNLVRDYFRIAESVGIETQYKVTKNPLNSIVDRPVEFNGSLTETITEGKNYFFKLRLYNSGGTAFKVLYKQAAVFSDSVGNVVFTCEANDQYSFGTQVGNTGGTKNIIRLITSWELKDVPYVDANAEVKKIECTIVEMPNLTYEQSMQLPLYYGTSTPVTSEKSLNVYKDARERLIFSYSTFVTEIYEFIMKVDTRKYRYRFEPGHTFTQYAISKWNNEFVVSNGYLYNTAANVIFFDTNLTQSIVPNKEYIFGELAGNMSVSATWTKLGVNVAFTNTYKIKFSYRMYIDDVLVKTETVNNNQVSYTSVYESSSSFSAEGNSHTCFVEAFVIIDNEEKLKITRTFEKEYAGSKVMFAYYLDGETIRNVGLAIDSDYATDDTDSIWFNISMGTGAENYTQTMADAFYSSTDKTKRYFKLYDVLSELNKSRAGGIIRLSTTISGVTKSYDVSQMRQYMRPHVRKKLNNYGSYYVYLSVPFVYYTGGTSPIVKYTYNGVTRQYTKTTGITEISIGSYPADAIIRVQMLYGDHVINNMGVTEYVLNLDDEIIT